MKSIVTKHLVLTGIIIFSFLVYGCRQSNNNSKDVPDIKMNQFSNPLWTGADPYVYVKDGYYHYTAPAGGNAIYTFKSKSLLDRGDRHLAYQFPPDKWNSGLNWGPSALFMWDDGRWYILYCAADGSDMAVNNINHRLGVLRALTDDPLGPYEDLTPDKPLDTGDTWAIASQPFQDFEGNWYITWSGVEEKNEFFPQCTFIAEMINPWTIGKRAVISKPDLPWEKSVDSVYVGETKIFVDGIQEGQTVIRRNNKLIMFYSADASWTDEYCLGMLTYSGGDIFSPDSWVKHPVPVFEKTQDIFGPGGAAITKSPDGTEDWLFYHAAMQSSSGWQRYVCLKKFTWGDNDIPLFGEPAPYGKMMDIPSGDVISANEK